jgi:hypothetical protein
MIRFSNISAQNRIAIPMRGVATPGVPGYLDLGPHELTTTTRLAFASAPATSKHQIAEMVAAGILEVAEIDAVHLYQDKGHVPATLPLWVENSTRALNAAITVSTDFAVKFNQHAAFLAVHTAATTLITAAVPTELVSMQIWLADAQVQYAAHVASAAAHSTPDTWNTLAPVVPIDIPTCIQAMQELVNQYNSHRGWWAEGTAAVLNVPAILTY